MTDIVFTQKRAFVRPLLHAFFSIPVLALVSFFWLGIPDSHIWQLVLSLAIGLVLVAAFLFIVSTALRSVRKPILPCSPWPGAFLLALWVFAEWILIALVSHIDDHATERAGFLNSKLGVHARTTFTFDRMVAWQHDLVLLLLWIIIPALLTPFLIETVARGLRASVWTAAAATLRQWQHWLILVVGNVSLYWITEKLTDWKPSHSVHGELVGLAVRLVVCYTIDFGLVVLIVAVDSKLLAREHARRYSAAEPPANAG